MQEISKRKLLRYVKRILVIRIGPLGETLQMTPVLTTLRNSLPNAYIAMMVTSDRVDVVSANPNLDEVITYESRIPKLICKLRKHHFQMALILQPTFRLVLLTFLAGIKYRVGFVTNSGGKLLLTTSVKNNHAQHETDRYLDIVRAVGIQPVAREIEMNVTKEAEQWAKDFLIRSNTSNERLLIGINPGSFWMNRRWAKERFAKVADTLASEYNAQILITIGPSEVGLGEEIATLMSHKPVILANTTPMRIAAVFKQFDLLISNDTGPMHIGIAVGTPTIGLFGNDDRGDSNPNRWGAIALQHVSIHRNGMETITVDEVMAVVRKKIADISNPNYL